MRHPALSLSAASLVLLAGVVAVWSLLAGPAPSAYAQLVEPLLDAQSGRFVIAAERRGEEIGAGVGYFDGPVSRVERSTSHGDTYTVHDGRGGKMLTVLVESKTAILADIPFFERDRKAAPDLMAKYGGGLLGSFRMHLDPASEVKPFGEGCTREEVEEETPGGVRHGVRLTTPGMTQTLWADPKTGEPDRVEIELTRVAGVKTVLKDFEFGAEVAPELLALEPPAGYKVVDETGEPASE